MFDCLADFDVCLSSPVAGGFVCNLQAKEDREVFASHKALLQAHVCEEFLRWCNDRLASARWLRLVETGGMRDASLIYKAEDRHSASKLRLIGNLTSLDGSPVIGVNDPIEVWIYPINDEQPIEHFKAILPPDR